MDDLTATRLCAEAMGIEVNMRPIRGTIMRHWYMKGHVETEYNPLYDDAQAMALVKKFKMTVCWTNAIYGLWRARVWYEGKTGAIGEEFDNDDLNRAIVYCVSAMQAKK